MTKESLEKKLIKLEEENTCLREAIEEAMTYMRDQKLDGIKPYHILKNTLAKEVK